MPLTKLQFRSGINREITSYSNEGGWTDCDKIRFVYGYPEKIGGWTKYTNDTYVGSARSLHNWLALDGANYLGIGTHLKFYIEEGGSIVDITPIRTTNTNTVSFSATNNSSNITVTDNSHGASEGDFVTFNGCVSLGGNVTAAILNAEHQIVSITNGNDYVITVSVTADSNDSGNGTQLGRTATYQINTGLDSQIGGTGWSAGIWGGQLTSAQTNTLNGALQNNSNGTGGTGSNITLASVSGFPSSGIIKVGNELITYTGVSSPNLTGIIRGAFSTTISAHNNGATVTDATTGWGMPAATTTATEIRTWSQDNWGEDLIINVRDDKIYYWDKTLGLSTRAVELSAVPNSANTPTVAKQVIVSDVDRHVICFGTNTYGTQIQDPLLIRWSTQESAIDWTISSTTTARDLRIGSGSTFVQAIKTKREIIVLTDTSIHSFKYIGDPFIFGIEQLANNITTMSSKGAVASEDFVFWMGIDNFYVYSGGTQQLPCPVKNKIFNNFNYSQREKVYAAVNSEYSEIIWFYPSLDNSIVNGGDGQNDKYVIYNYKEQVWYYGNLPRTAWIDRSLRPYPIATQSNIIYNQEFDYDDDGSAMSSFIESAPLTIGDGNEFSLVQRILPDLTFEGSLTGSAPAANFSLKTKNFPGTNFNETDTETATRIATTPVEQYTNQLFLRARGRSFALRIDSSSTGTKWKLGTPRVELKRDGRQ